MPKILTEKEVVDLLEGLAGGPVVYFAENVTKYTTEECLQAYYDSLEKQLAEKDAIIDWLAERCKCFESDYHSEHKQGVFISTDWRKAAQEAVKKND